MNDIKNLNYQKGWITLKYKHRIHFQVTLILKLYVHWLQRMVKLSSLDSKEDASLWIPNSQNGIVGCEFHTKVKFKYCGFHFYSLNLLICSIFFLSLSKNFLLVDYIFTQLLGPWSAMHFTCVICLIWIILLSPRHS